MTIDEAANALVWWLAHVPGVAFVGEEVLGREIGPCHYRMAVQQMQPEHKRRVFEFAALELPDCYELREVS